MRLRILKCAAAIQQQYHKGDKQVNDWHLHCILDNHHHCLPSPLQETEQVRDVGVQQVTDLSIYLKRNRLHGLCGPNRRLYSWHKQPEKDKKKVRWFSLHQNKLQLNLHAFMFKKKKKKETEKYSSKFLHKLDKAAFNSKTWPLVIQKYCLKIQHKIIIFGVCLKKKFNSSLEWKWQKKKGLQLLWLNYYTLEQGWAINFP